MRNEINLKILANVSPADFTGREVELESLTEPVGRDAGSCVLLNSAPGSGSSELLRQASDKLFREQTALPVYFSIRRSDRSAAECVRRFLFTVSVQAVAFGRRDARIIKYSPGVEELMRQSLPGEFAWVSRVASEIDSGPRTVGGSSIASSLGLAVRTAESRPVVFFIDHLNEAEFIDEGTQLLQAFDEISAASNARFVFSAFRRSRIGFSKCRQMKLEALSHQQIGRLTEERARHLNVPISEQARDLIAAQMIGKPGSALSLVAASAAAGSPLETFRQVQTAYTDQLLGGGIARGFDAVLNDAAHAQENQKSIISILNDLTWSGSNDFPVERWEQLSGLGTRAGRALEILNTRELVRVSNGRIEAMHEDRLLADYVDARFRLEVGSGNRALVVGDSLNLSLKRAPALMAEFYRRSTSLGIRELLATFEATDVPAALLDYGRFAAEYKVAPDSEVLKDVRQSSDTIHIPQIVQAVYTEDVYRPISQVSERERSAVGRGFNARRYSDEEEITWITAEIDSKLEATREIADFWCDRLEMAALFCDFSRYRIWLIAPEGFSATALERMNARNAIGSSRKQVELLRGYLSGAETPKTVANEEYEIVVPMGDETELIAAHAIEEIAKRHNMDAKSINQIKTALVEACINAVEHSLSPDRKIYQKFSFDDEKITITISNRGVRLTDRRTVADEPIDGRRGWGLALMRRLMDEVTIEDVDDGTMISMTKYLPKTA